MANITGETLNGIIGGSFMAAYVVHLGATFNERIHL